MGEQERFRRGDPERIAPMRNWSALSRPPDAPAAAIGPTYHANGFRATNASMPISPAAPLPDDEIAEAVATAYRVVDDHLRAGRDAARALNRDRVDSAASDGGRCEDSAGFASLGAGLEELIGEAARAFAGLIPAVAAMFEAFGRSPYMSAAAFTDHVAAGAGSRAADAATRPDLAIEVASARPARVTLELALGADPATLASAGLLAIESGRSPLTDIKFIPARDGERAVLSVRVPDSAAPGVYAGAIVDRTSGVPRGTLAVRVGE